MKEYTVRVTEYNTIWYYNDEVHRDDGPAVEYANGDKHYYQHGKLHRADGPAVIYADEEQYYINGIRVHPPAKRAKVEFIIFDGTQYQVW